ncbi:ABC transporter ATP-binding protein [Bacillus cereus]
MKIKIKERILLSDLFQTYRWLISFISPYKNKLLIIIILGFIISFSNLVVPKIIQYFIDNSIGKDTISKFYTILLLIIFGVLIFNLIAIPLRNIKQRELQEYCARDLQLHILEHLRKLDIEYSEKNSSGKILSLLSTEVKNVQQLYNKLLPLFIQDLLFAIVSLFLMINTSAKLTLITVPVFLVYYLFGPYIEKKASISGKEMSNNHIQLGHKRHESISSITEMNINGSVNWNMKNFLRYQDLFNKSMVTTYFYAFFRGTIRRLSYYLGGIILTIVGYLFIKNNVISLGAFIAFFLYYFNAMHKLTSVITFITEQKVLMYQAQNLYNFSKEKPKFKEEEFSVGKKINSISQIEFKNVSFSYENGKKVLDNLDLTINKGDKVVIVGNSGSGKTTIFKLLMRFYSLASGSINLDGKPINEISLSNLRDYFGYVTQETYLFGSSILENIKFANPNATIEQIVEAAKMAQAHEFINKLPYGYNTLVGERGIKLSGGQKQRISLARIFLKNPDIILLDEATASLDSNNEKYIYSTLEQISNEKTLIAIAHRISSIKKFEKIVVLDKGRIVEYGSFDELIKKNGIFTKIINQQKHNLEV